MFKWLKKDKKKVQAEAITQPKEKNKPEKKIAANARDNRRKEQRINIEWSAHARGTGYTLLGVPARDISPEGMFLQYRDYDPTPVDGDSLKIDLFPKGQACPTTGKIKWKGFSKTHRCEGVGIQFDDPEKVSEIMNTYKDRLDGRGHL